MRGYPLIPGVPAAGHIDARGFWRPGAPPPPKPPCSACGNSAVHHHAPQGKYHPGLAERCGWCKNA